MVKIGATMTRLQPLNKRILVKVKVKEVSDGGIVLPNASTKGHDRGTVVGKAPDCESGVELGNLVLFTAYHGNPMELDGEHLLMLNEGDLLGRFAQE